MMQKRNARRLDLRPRLQRRPMAEPLESRSCPDGSPPGLSPPPSPPLGESLISLLPLRSVEAVEGISSGRQVVAIFRDPLVRGSYKDYHALIDWGDGSAPDPSAVVAPGYGVFNVFGSHRFAEQGRFEVLVRIAVDAAGPTPGGEVVAHSDSFVVRDAPLTSAGLQTTWLHLDAGIDSGDSWVATFADANPGASPDEFAASIDWGDGSGSDATAITRFNTTTYKVHGRHAYAWPGAYRVTTTIRDIEAPDGSVTVGADTTAIVANSAPPIFSAVGTTGIVAIAGTPFTAQLATVSVVRPRTLNLAPSDFVARIDWGDGTPVDAVATVTQPAGRGTPFVVAGTHTYATRGTYAPIVSILGPAGVRLQARAEVQVEVQVQARVAPPVVTAVNVSMVENAAFDGRIAQFSEQNPAAKASDFAATVVWPDGAVVDGVITPDPDHPGLFNVACAFASGGPGRLDFTVRIRNAGGVGEAVGTATVLDARLAVLGSPKSIAGVVGERLDVAVADFVDTDRAASLANFSAVIDWGDGASSAGSIAALAGGGFGVSGTHRYTTAGRYALRAILRDVGGESAEAGAASEITASLPAVPASASAAGTNGGGTEPRRGGGDQAGGISTFGGPDSGGSNSPLPPALVQRGPTIGGVVFDPRARLIVIFISPGSVGLAPTKWVRTSNGYRPTTGLIVSALGGHSGLISEASPGIVLVRLGRNRALRRGGFTLAILPRGITDLAGRPLLETVSASIPRGVHGPLGIVSPQPTGVDHSRLPHAGWESVAHLRRTLHAPRPVTAPPTSASQAMIAASIPMSLEVNATLVPPAAPSVVRVQRESSAPRLGAAQMRRVPSGPAAASHWLSGAKPRQAIS
jgi:hypothetical protein